MTDQDAYGALLEEMDADLRTDGIVCLYQFSWFQDIGNPNADAAAILATCRDAYAELRRRHPESQLVWVNWPTVSPDAATPADPQTPLDFLLDPQERGNPRLMALRCSGPHGSDEAAEG